MKKLQKKVKDLLGSIRFWIVTLTAAIAILELYATNTATLANILDILKMYGGAVVGIGTLDSVASKIKLK